MTDLPVEYGRIRQQTGFDRAGNAIEEMIVPFHIGPHGPFTERMTLAEYNDGVTLRSRVDRIKATLSGLPR
jgi:hypothetical protein